MGATDGLGIACSALEPVLGGEGHLSSPRCVGKGVLCLTLLLFCPSAGGIQLPHVKSPPALGKGAAEAESPEVVGIMAEPELQGSSLPPAQAMVL